MKILLAVLMGIGSVALCANTAGRPNIVFFVTDDHDFDQMPTTAFNAVPEAVAPTIEKLSRGGATFKNAYLTTSVCAPSRYTFLTGRYPGACYSENYKGIVKNNCQGSPEFNTGVESDGMNLAAQLSKGGYCTGFVGKTHCADHKRLTEIERNTPKSEKPEIRAPREPKTRNLSKDVSDAMYKDEKILRKYIVEGIGFDWAKNLYYGNTRIHNPAWTLEAALEFLDSNGKGEKPFFLYYATTLVHGPTDWKKSAAQPDYTGEGIVTPAPHVEQLEEFSDIEKRIIAAGYDEQLIRKKNYMGLAWIDASVKVIVDKLKEDDLLDNTIFVYVADNGIEGKATVYERGTRASMIIRYPKRIKPSVVLSDVSSADIAPTLLEMAGVDVPEGYKMNGKSIVKTFDNPTAEIHPDGVYSELGMARSVVKNGWKYIAVRMTDWKAALIDGKDPVQSIYRLGYITNAGLTVSKVNHYDHYFDADQLYNLDADPDEKTNLAEDPKCAEKLAEMKKLLLAHLREVGTPYGEFITGSDTMAPGDWQKRSKDVADMVDIKGSRARLKTNPNGTFCEKPKTPSHNTLKKLGIKKLKEQQSQ